MLRVLPARLMLRRVPALLWLLRCLALLLMLRERLVLPPWLLLPRLLLLPSYAAGAVSRAAVPPLGRRCRLQHQLPPRALLHLLPPPQRSSCSCLLAPPRPWALLLRPLLLPGSSVSPSGMLSTAEGQRLMMLLCSVCSSSSITCARSPGSPGTACTAARQPAAVLRSCTAITSASAASRALWLPCCSSGCTTDMLCCSSCLW